MTALPSHLYHYTSIESLALILSTKTIRFGRLSLFNDREEGTSHDLPGIEAHVYGSCWTDSAVESLPLWKLYAGEMKGCRIRLPVNPFDGDLTSASSLKGAAETYIKLHKPVHYAPSAMRGTKCDLHEILGPTRITYDDDPNALPPAVVTDTGAGAKFDAWNTGLAKKEHWRFEEEWRYRIHTQPEGSESGYSESEDGDRVSFLDVQLYPPTNNSIDVPIREEALADLEIKLAPLTGDAERAIAKKFAPKSATIDKSSIDIRETSQTAGQRCKCSSPR